MSTSDSAACELSVKAARSASTSEFAVSAGRLSVKAVAYASISAACRLYAYYAIVSADASKLIHGDNTEFQAGRD